ncbi:MAG: hypothetical protein RJA49_611 [Actinomycetota bacterium]|jgi:hypothetical protein
MLRLGSRRVAGRAKRISVAVIGATLIASLGTASAATLGGLSAKTLFGQSGAVGVLAGTTVTCDNFTAGASSAIDGRAVQLPAACGARTWTRGRGTWTITTGQAGSTSSANASVYVPVGSTDVSVEATLFNLAGQVGGVALSHTGTGRIYVAGVVSATNTVQIRLVNRNTVTALASAPFTIGATVRLRLTRQGSTLTLRVNGTVAVTATLTAAQITSLTGGTSAGLYAAASATIRFDDFLVTTPFP